MSADFANTYQEILLENLMAIIKQNFVFQTQIKLSENIEKQRSDLFEQNNSLKTELESLRPQIAQLDSYKTKAEQNNSAHEEKSRIQSALNEEMKKNSVMKKELEDKNSDINKLFGDIESKNREIEELQLRISKLESAIPQTKLKKLDKPQLESFIADVAKENTQVLELVENGGSF